MKDLTIRPHAELTMLEAKKYEKAAWNQDMEAENLINDISGVQHISNSLVIEIEGKRFSKHLLKLFVFLW